MIEYGETNVQQESSMPNSASRSISIVVPVYGCDSCLKNLCERLSAVLPSLARDYEIILVDDRSPDDSWKTISELHEKIPQIKGVRLSKNFGQHIAISSGLAEAKGDLTIVMDCDLQDPPEKIPELVAKLDEGYEIVLARRSERSHSRFRVTASNAYFKLMSMLNEENIDGSYGTFSILTRKAVNAFLAFGEKERHYLFIVRWLGFSVGNIEYEHQERCAGTSSYSLKNLVRHAISGLFFQATVLLRWIVTAGLLFAFFGTCFAVFLIYQYLFLGALSGWTSLAVLILICTGAILTSLGIIGLYIGKIFEQIKGRPLYINDTVLEREAQW